MRRRVTVGPIVALLLVVKSVVAGDVADRLVDVVFAHDLRGLRAIIEANPKVVNQPLKCKGMGEYSVLSLVAAVGDAESALYLLRNGANPNLVVDNNLPLIWALSYGHARVARLLLRYGAQLNCTNCLEPNYLLLFNTPRVVQAFQDRGLHLDLNRYTSSGEPWLFEAVRHANLEAVKFMLQNGVSAKVADHGQNTALHVLATAWTGDDRHCLFAHDAALRRRLRVAELLIEHGADLNALNAEGASPLQNVIQHSDRQWRQMLVIKLLESGADAKQPVPLYETIICGDLGLLKVLLAHGADPNQLVCGSGPRGEWRFTATRVIVGLMLADPKSRATWIQMAELAVRYGGDLNVTDASGSSPIEEIRKSGIKSLIRRFRADPSRKDG